MLQNPKYRKRLITILICFSFIAAGIAIILSVFKDNIIFFYSPTDIYEKKARADGKIIRIGGLVQERSLITLSSGEIQFIVTDLKNNLLVHYKGIIPALFKEGQGVVALGKLEEGSKFKAMELLAKHDENYMPKEVQKALEKSGRWKHYKSGRE